MPRQRRINIKSHTILSMLLLAFVLSLCFGAVKMTAYADNGDFNIDAQMLPSSKDTYNISVTIENMGEDWEGVARLKVGIDSNYYDDCAYDTAISLPHGSLKQFVVEVPKHRYNFSYIPSSLTSSMISGRMTRSIVISLIDKNSKPVFSQEFDRFFRSMKKDALNMGILSDNYSSLTFMDMGGDKISYYGVSYPIKLVELNQDNLIGSLDSLEFLVIDNYGTGILTPDESAAVEEWNNDGGVLIVGTGKYAEDTLAGLDYLEVEYKGMSDAEDDDYAWGGSAIDVEGLETAELVYPNDLYDEDSSIAALTMPKGDGAIGVLPYSLTEFAGQHSDAYIYTMQNDFIYYMLNDISANAARRYSAASSAHRFGVNNSAGLLSVLGNGSASLSFGWLKVIMAVYVIIVGPVLYLVLKSLKKRDLYCAAVPVLAFMGVIIIMFAGKGFEIARIRVYSVTVCDSSGRDDCLTYMHCYNADNSEWKLRLSQDYEYAAPNLCDSVTDGVSYNYRVLKESERLFFGADPAGVFEDIYFYADKKSDVQSIGSIDCNVSLYAFDVKRINKVTNNTKYDFEYFAVIDDDCLWLYEGLAAGETCNPVQMEEILKIDTDSYFFYIYDYIGKAQDKLNPGNIDVITALGLGINTANYRLRDGERAVVGVTSDYIKAVDDNCSEEAYGCFYIIQ
ncbi:MAG: hypothetical protein NC313_08950 [Butyrivibrio sp.]|nr:hypothetical protein [Butyrivibrio sp.]